MNKSTITKAIAVTQKVCGGRDIEPDVVRAYLAALERYEDAVILRALDRCAREVRGHVSLSDIVRRIPDPWPTADQAWALCPTSDAQTVIWFDECNVAYDEVHGLGDDRIAMRVAFKDAYSRIVQEAKDGGKKCPAWNVSLGTNVAGREGAIMEAVRKGRIELETARQCLPMLDVGDYETKALPPAVEEGAADPDEVKRYVAKLKKQMGAEWLSD